MKRTAVFVTLLLGLFMVSAIVASNALVDDSSQGMSADSQISQLTPAEPVLAYGDVGQCMGDCASDQGICIGGCQGDSNCIARCADAYGRCVSRCY